LTVEKQPGDSGGKHKPREPEPPHPSMSQPLPPGGRQSRGEWYYQMSIVKGHGNPPEARIVAARSAVEILSDDQAAPRTEALGEMLREAAAASDPRLRAALWEGVGKLGWGKKSTEAPIYAIAAVNMLEDETDPGVLAAGLRGLRSGAQSGEAPILQPIMLATLANGAKTLAYHTDDEVVHQALGLLRVMTGLAGENPYSLPPRMLYRDGGFMDRLGELAVMKGKKYTAEARTLHNSLGHLVAAREGGRGEAEASLEKAAAYASSHEVFEDIVAGHGGDASPPSFAERGLFREAVVDRGMEPADYLGSLFRKRVRAVFVAFEWAGEAGEGGRLLRELLAVKNDAGLTHVAVPLPEGSAQDDLAALLAGRLDPSKWMYEPWGGRADDVPEFVRNTARPDELEGYVREKRDEAGEYGGLLAGLAAGGVKIVTYDPTVPLHGELKAERMARAIGRPLREGPFNSVVALGGFDYFANAGLEEVEGGLCDSAAKRLSGELGEGKVASVLRVTSADLEVCEHYRISYPAALMDGISRSFGIDVAGTPLEGKRFNPAYRDGFERWDGIVVLAEDDGGAWRQPKQPRGSRVRGPRDLAPA
jgi:hypothetical protein